MATGDVTTLRRDCPAMIVPGGHYLTLPAGTAVTVLETLPDGVTVKVGHHGSVAVIMRADADALGEAGAPPPQPTPVPSSPQPATSGQQPAQQQPVQPPGSLEEAIWTKLRGCFDPEIPVNIVELGLVYGCRVERREEGARVTVDLTLTAPGCSMGDVLKSEIESKLLSIDGVDLAEVQLVMDPPWDPSRMSEAARLELGLF